MEAAHDSKRGVELRVSNAVFSKLVKIGRDKRRTPQQAAQELFDQAYAEHCLGKSAAAQVAAAGALADAIESDLKQQLEEARLQRDNALCMLNGAMVELGEQKRISAELSARCWNAEAERDKAREEVAEKPGLAEIHRRVFPDGIPIEIPPPTVEENARKVAGLRRLIRARHACGLSRREIARELGLDLAVVTMELA